MISFGGEARQRAMQLAGMAAENISQPPRPTPILIIQLGYSLNSRGKVRLCSHGGHD